MTDAQIEQLATLLGNDRVSRDPDALAAHSYDAWPVAVKWRRQNKAPLQPEAIVTPTSVDDVSRLLAWASAHNVPVTPWGAGSAVTGAPLAAQGGVSLDLGGMDKTIALNRINHTVRVEAGKMGHHLEAELHAAGLTLNHSPQSLDRSTVGGWLATRASGQFSSRWGSIENLCVSFTVVLPDGRIIEMPDTPRSATGPDLRHLFIGSEGTMGVIVDVTMRVFELAEQRLYETVVFDRLTDGIDAIRRIMQHGLRPFVLRLYDEDEAPHAMKDASSRQPVLFLGCEGTSAMATTEMNACVEVCSADNGTPVGGAAVEAWMERRFDFSAVENVLDRPGGFAETIEIASGWDKIGQLYQDMKAALVPLADEVLGHFSHAYTHGTSLYLILIGACEDDDAAEQRLLEIWDVAMERCLAGGGAISHHHGIGYVRRQYLKPYLGEVHDLLCNVRSVVDSAGIMNPGKFV
ncbi:MAG TPA: FAD-binding oxidoreductase [Lentisphaeria bacterium]|jgi:alkyldihydroxyacetonephosphate synthase|nr:FAD-binding oxidoreductase [Lentisphaeria bacterium]|tara:strand:+ start:126 stop:1514 length:1389 start_codon:yes stop_codon:yes gene_type:complete